jgi:hypothetical protein
MPPTLLVGKESVMTARRALGRFNSRAYSIYFFLGFIALGYFALIAGWVDKNQIAAMAIGGAVGCVEILGRYRHSPVRAVLTLNGFGYVLINMFAAYVAYYMLDAFEIFKSTTLAKDLTHVLTAGLGSLVFMRSSIFKVRIGESDIGIGPAAILDTLLLVADRGVDRREAVARAQDVTELVAHVRDPLVVAKMLTKYSLSLMQNVDSKTSAELGDAVSKIMADTDVPDAIKIDIVALRIGVVVGPDVLEAAVAALGDRLHSVPPGALFGQRAPGQQQATPTAEQLKAEIDKASSND